MSHGWIPFYSISSILPSSGQKSDQPPWFAWDCPSFSPESPLLGRPFCFEKPGDAGHPAGWAESDPSCNGIFRAHSTLAVRLTSTCWLDCLLGGHWPSPLVTTRWALWRWDQARKLGAAEPHSWRCWVDTGTNLALGFSPCGLLPLWTAFYWGYWYVIFCLKRTLVRTIKWFLQRQPGTSWFD